MEFIDFCFIGNNIIGPKIIELLEEKGVFNEKCLSGTDSKKVYFVNTNKEGIFEIFDENISTISGRHILNTRSNIRIETFSLFEKKFMETSFKKNKNFSDEEEIINLVKQGFSNKEISEKLNIKYANVAVKICQYRKKGLLPPVEECERRRARYETRYERRSDKNENENISNDKKDLIQLSGQIINGLLSSDNLIFEKIVDKVFHKQIADSAVNIAYEMLNKIEEKYK